MARKKILFGVGAGIASTAVEGACGLVSLPLLLKYLPLQEAGFWNLGTTLVGFLGLVQGGLGPTISREFAILRGKSEAAISGSESAGSMASIRWAGWIVFAGVAVIASIIYGAYLRPISEKNNLGLGSVGAWAGLTVSTAINLAAAQIMSVLEGLGEVGWDRVMRILFAILNLALFWVLLRSGQGLNALGLSVVAQALLRYWLARKVLFRFFPALDGPPFGGSVSRQVKSLFATAAKLFVLSVAGYVINNLGLFLMERRFGLRIVPEYNALIRVGLLISTVCMLVPQMLYPYVARAWAAGDRQRVRRYYLLGIIGAVSVCIAAIAVVLSFHQFIFPRWLGAQHYLGFGMLLPIMIYALIYSQHVAQATPVLACFGNAFAIPAILNAVLVFPFCYWGAKYLGPAGIPWGTVAATIIPSIWVSLTAYRLIWRNPTKPLATPHLATS